MGDSDHLSLNGKLMKLFVDVFDTGSIGQAAMRLGLNQSTVSHSIEKLRKILDDPLFVKSGRGIIPTDRAIMLAPRFRELLSDLESISSIGEYEPQADTKHVTIAANASLHLDLFCRLRDELALAAPNASLWVVDLGSRGKVETVLSQGMVDLAISVRPVRYAGTLNYAELISCGFSCFYDASCRNPIETIDDYCAARHAVVGLGSDLKSLVDLALDQLMLRRFIALKVPSLTHLPALIKGTELITTMPDCLASTIFSDLASCPPPVDVGQIQFDLVWHRKNERSDRNSWFRDKILSIADRTASGH